jgi:hypothetical protein
MMKAHRYTDADELKADMLTFLREKFKGLVDFYDVSAVEFSLEEAIYYFASQYHHGQWSALYSILSTSDFRPGRLHTFERFETEEDFAESKMFFDALVSQFA